MAKGKGLPLGDATTIDSGPGRRDAIRLTQRPGEVLGERYELIELLGVGSFGAVWRARDRVAAEIVAVKLMAIDRGAPGQLDRLRRELRAARKVLHQGVVRIHDLIEVGEHLVLSMELVEGETLQAWVDREGRLDPAAWTTLARDLASGLAAAHDAGVAHRDLKPANILVRKGTGRAVITDFGVSRLVEIEDGLVDDAATRPDGEVALTAEGAVVGTPLYMAPEQLDGRRADQASDVYALGLVLQYAALGRLTSASPTILALLYARSQPVPPLAPLRDDLPEGVCAAVDRMLAHAPEARPGARELAAQLDGGPPTAAVALASRRRWPSIPVAIAAVTIAIAIAIAIVAVVAPWRSGGRPAPPPANRALRTSVVVRATTGELRGLEDTVAAMARRALATDLRLDLVDAAAAHDAEVVVVFWKDADRARLRATVDVGGREVALGELDGASMAEAIARLAPQVRELAGDAPPRGPSTVESTDMAFLDTTSFEAYRLYKQAERDGFSTVATDNAAIEASLGRAIELDPGWVHPYLALALARGVFSEGTAEPIRAARAHADPARDRRGWRLLDHMEALRSGDHAAARTIGEAIVDPRDVTGSWLLSVTYLFQDLADQNIGLLRRMHEQHPDLQFGYDLMMALRQTGRADEVPAMVTAWRARAPDSEQARGAEITLASTEQHWGDAVRMARDIIFLHGAQPHRLTAHCDVLIAAGQLDEARAIADRMLHADPVSHARGLYRLGVIAILEGRFAGAYESLQQAFVASRPLGTNGETIQVLQSLVSLAWVGAPDDLEHWHAELVETYATHGAIGEAATSRFEIAQLQRRDGAACPDLDAALATIPERGQRSRARNEMLRVAFHHDCASCADVVQAGRSFREINPRSLLRFADCAGREGAGELADRAFEDIVARRVTPAGMGGTIDHSYEWVLTGYHQGRAADARDDHAAARLAYQAFIARWGKADRVVPEVEAARDALAELPPP